MSVELRSATLADNTALFHLYKKVAKVEGGIVRSEPEITNEYIQHNLTSSLEKGICLVLEEINSGEILAEIHSFPLTPKAFAHVLSELTIVVDPEHQGKGYGKRIFTAFLDKVRTRPDILKVELIARESNRKAISLYESLGFKKEGFLEKRLKNNEGNYLADIPMGWFNSGYKN